MKRALVRFGALLGLLVWLLRIRRRVVLENLARAFPGLPDRNALARRCYQQLGMSLVEVLLRLDALVTFEGWEKYEAAHARGRGTVCAIAHFGNWELLARACGQRGVRLHIITRRLQGAFNRWLLGVRGEAGLRSLADKGVSAEATAILRRNEVLAVAVDQNMRPRRGVFVDFFGVPACTTPSAAVYALRTGATLLAAFPVRQPDGTHRVLLEGPFTPRDGLQGHAAVLDLTQQLTSAVERIVRAHPEQWFWLHRRWKTRPDAPRGTLAP